MNLPGLDQTILGLDGVALQEEGGVPLTIGRAMASMIARGNDDDPVRAMAVGLQLYHANEVVSLDDAEYALLVRAVGADRSFVNIVRAACLSALDGATHT